MYDMTQYADCGDAPSGCDWPGGDFATLSNRVDAIRLRPTRNDLLTLLTQNLKQRVTAQSICQSDCSHCYAGHCGTSVANVISH